MEDINIYSTRRATPPEIFGGVVVGLAGLAIPTAALSMGVVPSVLSAFATATAFTGVPGWVFLSAAALVVSVALVAFGVFLLTAKKDLHYVQQQVAQLRPNQLPILPRWVREDRTYLTEIIVECPLAYTGLTEGEKEGVAQELQRQPEKLIDVAKSCPEPIPLGEELMENVDSLLSIVEENTAYYPILADHCRENEQSNWSSLATRLNAFRSFSRSENRLISLSAEDQKKALSLISDAEVDQITALIQTHTDPLYLPESLCNNSDLTPRLLRINPDYSGQIALPGADSFESFLRQLSTDELGVFFRHLEESVLQEVKAYTFALSEWTEPMLMFWATDGSYLIEQMERGDEIVDRVIQSLFEFDEEVIQSFICTLSQEHLPQWMHHLTADQQERLFNIVFASGRASVALCQGDPRWIGALIRNPNAKKTLSYEQFTKIFGATATDIMNLDLLTDSGLDQYSGFSTLSKVDNFIRPDFPDRVEHAIKFKAKTQLSTQAVSIAIPYLTDSELQRSLNKPQSGRSDVCFIQEHTFTLVMKKSRDLDAFSRNEAARKRFEKKQQAVWLCMHKDLHCISIPPARVCGEFLVEEALPLKESFIEALDLYVENLHAFDQAVEEMCLFLIHSQFADIVGGNKPWWQGVFGTDKSVGTARYDNVALFVEGGVGKIGLIDLEGFSPLCRDPRDADLLDAYKKAVVLFPFHKEQIDQFFVGQDLTGLDSVQDSYKQNLGLIEQVYLTHRDYVAVNPLDEPALDLFANQIYLRDYVAANPLDEPALDLFANQKEDIVQEVTQRYYEEQERSPSDQEEAAFKKYFACFLEETLTYIVNYMQKKERQRGKLDVVARSVILGGREVRKISRSAKKRFPDEGNEEGDYYYRGEFLLNEIGEALAQWGYIHTFRRHPDYKDQFVFLV